MRKILCMLLATCWLLSCNKVIEEVELPPFIVYPNPFTDAFSVHFDTNRYPNSFMTVYVLDGNGDVLISLDHGTAAGDISLSMTNYQEGIYYLEMELEGKTFNEPILKAK